jgi:YggT family protein
MGMTVASLFDALAGLLSLAILARVLYSWVDPNPYSTNPVKELLFRITEPILAPIRDHMPPLGMVDVSPIVAIILLQLLSELVRSLAPT